MKDLISIKNCRTNNIKKSKADFTVRKVYFPIFRKTRPLFFKVCLYPEEERPYLSEYWKIYFPDREISLALFRVFVVVVLRSSR